MSAHAIESAIDSGCCRILSSPFHIQIQSYRRFINHGEKKLSNRISLRVALMYSSLHRDVANAVVEHIGSTRFHENNSDEGSNHQYSTCVMGTLRCNNEACRGDVWDSGRITILIRKYPDNGYNVVVFSHRCQYCV
jgi:hypothetical protein